MKRADFIKVVSTVRKELYKKHNWLCNLFASTILRESHTNEARDKLSIVILYKEIQNGKESTLWGLFGNTCYNNEGYEERKTSLDLFERVVLDEKLYKEL